MFNRRTVSAMLAGTVVAPGFAFAMTYDSIISKLGAYIAFLWPKLLILSMRAGVVIPSIGRSPAG